MFACSLFSANFFPVLLCVCVLGCFFVSSAKVPCSDEVKFVVITYFINAHTVVVPPLCVDGWPILIYRFCLQFFGFPSFTPLTISLNVNHGENNVEQATSYAIQTNTFEI